MYNCSLFQTLKNYIKLDQRENKKSRSCLMRQPAIIHAVARTAAASQERPAASVAGTGAPTP